MGLRTLAWWAALASSALLLGAGLGVRADLWHYRTGFMLLGAAGFIGLAAAALSIFVLSLPKLRRRGIRVPMAALAVGAAVAFVPWQLQQHARSLPAIHDISTDTENPPPLAATYGGQAIAEQQRRAYPDIRPLMLAVPPSIAFSRARDAAEESGWQIVASDRAAGRIEAVATTFWFGFKDDVAVRISAVRGGSRIDVRSVSRVGRGDAGANARRIREYLGQLRS
jgi:uncharacterized protein (DUF1499 family)